MFNLALFTAMNSVLQASRNSALSYHNSHNNHNSHNSHNSNKRDEEKETDNKAENNNNLHKLKITNQGVITEIFLDDFKIKGCQGIELKQTVNGGLPEIKLTIVPQEMEIDYEKIDVREDGIDPRELSI